MSELSKIKAGNALVKSGNATELEKSEQTLRKARLLARTTFPYFGTPLTAMSITITETATYPMPKKVIDAKGNVHDTEKPDWCAGETEDDWIMPTFAVDKKMRTYCHPMAIDMWVDEAKKVDKKNPCQTCGKTSHHPLAYVAGVFIHEMWHPLRKHHVRAGHYKPVDPQLWNIAADFEINDGMVEYSKGESTARVCLPHGVLLPKDFKYPNDLLAEQYYELLMKEVDKSKMAPGGRCGSGADGQGKEFEVGGDGDGKDLDEGVSTSEQAAMANKLADDVQKANAKRPGSVPNSLVRWAGEQLEPPRYDWKKDLNQQIRYCSSRYVAGSKHSTYARPARVSITSDFAVVLPTYKSPVPEVAVVIDTSGSVCKKALSMALSETEAICKLVRSRIQLVDVDTEARSQYVRSIKTANIIGGGGTDMVVGIQKALNGKHKPNVIIVMTDGYSPWEMKKPLGTSVIVCLVGDNVGEQGVMPWMHIVYVNDNNVRKVR